MMRPFRLLSAALAGVVLSAVLVSPAHATISGSGSSGTVTYTASTDNFANPERGFYHHTGDCDKADFSQSTLQGYRASQGISLVMCVFYLAEYKNGPIAQAALDQLQQQIDTVRAAGLKTDYEPTVLNSWNTGGCLADVTKNLGYRFRLETGTYPATASPGGGLPVSFTVHNDGYATPFNPRNLELVLRNTSTGATSKLTMSSDPRRWTAGASTTVSQTLTVPTTLPAGSYTLLLNLPDPLLSTRPEYSIRLANQGTWDAATGMNSLLHTLTVS